MYQFTDSYGRTKAVLSVKHQLGYLKAHLRGVEAVKPEVVEVLKRVRNKNVSGKGVPVNVLGLSLELMVHPIVVNKVIRRLVKEGHIERKDNGFVYGGKHK